MRRGPAADPATVYGPAIGTQALSAFDQLGETNSPVDGITQYS
jgi:hypothetical protein